MSRRCINNNIDNTVLQIIYRIKCQMRPRIIGKYYNVYIVRIILFIKNLFNNINLCVFNLNNTAIFMYFH